MKKFTLFATVAMSGYLFAGAATVDFTAPDGVIYTIDTTAKEATVKDIPREAAITNLVVPDAVEYEGTQYPVTVVGEKAAQQASSTLESIQLGSNVREVGDNAFYGIAKVSVIKLNDGLKTIGANGFYNCRVATELTLPESLESIGSYAFYNGYALRQIEIPASVSTIGLNPWGGCTGLQKITVAEANKSFTAIDDVLFSKDGSLLISYPIGRDAAEYTVPAGCKYIGENSMRNNSRMSKLILSEGLEEIRAGAFNVCRFQELNIPASVTFIGSRVFTSNPNLNTIKVAEGNKNYAAISNYLCTKDGKTLIQGVPGANIVIPESVDSISGYAFYNMPQIQSLKLNNVRSIGETAFYGATSLSSIDWGSKIERIGGMVFQRCVSLKSVEFPSTLRALSDVQTFAQCSQLASVKFNDGLEEIGTHTFMLCSALTSIEIPGTVKIWGDAPFNNCVSLQSAVFNEGITELPPSVLSYASALTSVKLANSIEKIGSFAFGYCQQLTEVNMPENLETVEAAAFEFVPIKKLVLPAKVKRLESNAFGYSGIEELTLNEGLEYIGSWAFGSSLISSAVVPEGVTEIGEGAFGYCENLTSLEIPASATILGNGIAQSCPKIASIVNKAVVPQTLTADVVDEDVYKTCMLKVPGESIKAYKAAAFWSKFNIDTSGVESIEENIDNAEIVEIYSISGVRQPELVNGINIVRLSDGSVKKIYHKM